MGCKNCRYSCKGYFKSRPDDYVCIGVPEPVLVHDNDICSSYKERSWSKVRNQSKEKIEDIIFQLKCVDEHIKFLARDDKSLDFDVIILKQCISRLEEVTL